MANVVVQEETFRRATTRNAHLLEASTGGVESDMRGQPAAAWRVPRCAGHNVRQSAAERNIVAST